MSVSEAVAANAGVSRSANALGVTLVILAATGFATKAIFVKLAYRHGVDAISLLALRMVFAQAFLVASWGLRWLWGRRQDAQTGASDVASPGWGVTSPSERSERRLTTKDVWGLLGLGLLGYYLASLLDFLGLEYISAALERLILFLYPTLVVLISAVFLRRTITRRMGVALVASYVGIGLVVVEDFAAPPPGFAIGALLVFGSTVSYSLYLVGNGELVRKLGATRVADVVTTVSAVAVLVHFACVRPLHALLQSAPVLGYAAAMGLFSTVLPIHLMAKGMARLGAGRTAMISAIGPVITIFLGVIVLGESLAALEMAGAALVIGGVYLVSQGK